MKRQLVGWSSAIAACAMFYFDFWYMDHAMHDYRWFVTPNVIILTLGIFVFAWFSMASFAKAFNFMRNWS